jgi:molecular chaperone GrpE
MGKERQVKIHTDDIEHSKKHSKKDTADTDKDLKKDDTSKPVDPLKEMEEKVETLEKEAAENHDRLLRMAAEFDNYKKRATREMNDFRKFANENFAKALLPVVDSMDLAIESSSNDKHVNNSMVEGVNMTLKEILKIFEQFGVKRFESIGNTFDPNLHQAVMQEETDKFPENTVSKELQKGFMIHDRLLRPAMVVVSKQPEKQKKKDQKE